MIKENEFIFNNKSSWDELYNLINKKKKTFFEIEKLGKLYQKITEDLSFAQTNLPDSKITMYLNEFVRKCHLDFYRPKKARFIKAIEFLITGFPKIIFQLKTPILISLFIFLSTTSLSFWLVKNNIELAEIFLDANTYEMIKSDLESRKQFGNFDKIPKEQRAPISLFIWFNNSKVALIAFVLGITFGLGTFYIIATNGFMLGSLLAVYFMNGNFIDFISIIMVHGSIELPAIIVSGGAGLFLAQAILIPQRERRIDKIKENSRVAFKCIIGVIIFLLYAGLIEGLVTTLKLPIIYRFTILCFNVFIVTVYLIIGAIVTMKDKR